MKNLHDYELMLALQRHNPDAFERIREGNLTLDDVRLQAQEALELERTPVRAEDEDLSRVHFGLWGSFRPRP